MSHPEDAKPVPYARRWVYHATEAPRLIERQEQEDTLGDGWADTPAAFVGSKPPPAPVTVGDPDLNTLGLAALREMAVKRGLPVHHRAGRERIIEILRAAGAA